jgi:outer membrane lipoprotein-sorting protein
MTEIANTPDSPDESGHHLRFMPQRRALRWLVPVGAAGVVALLASGVLSATANPNLPAQTAAQLLASMDNSSVVGFSGTIVEKASLGLPELPNIGGSDSSTGLTGMLTGSHTSRVWYGGETKQRFALLDTFGEQDIFRNGREVWHWDSNTKTATKTLLPEDAAGKSAAPTETATITPEQAAQQALDLVDPSTNVSTDRTGVVAGRAVYTLVLTPKDTRSRVASVRISVDGQHKLPLGVQIYARGASHPALDVSFTRIDFSVPGDEYFTFAPPADAKTPQPKESPGSPRPFAAGTEKSPNPSITAIGTGWTTVGKVVGVPSVSEIGKQNKDAGLVLGKLPEVKGSWGQGKLFESALVTALFTDDGRVYFGAVDPDILYAAAGQK